MSIAKVELDNMASDVAAADAFPTTTILPNPGRKTMGRITESLLELHEGFPLCLLTADHGETIRDPELNAKHGKRDDDHKERRSFTHGWILEDLTNFLLLVRQAAVHVCVFILIFRSSLL